MKISTKVECGIIALVDIAVNSAKGEVVKVAAISERNNRYSLTSDRAISSTVSRVQAADMFLHVPPQR